MKNKYSHTLIIKTITLFLFLASFCTVNSQTTYFLRNEGGNWNANTTWSTVSSSSSINAGTFPTTGDNVYFNGTGTVNLNITANAACANFYNQSLDGAFLNLNLSGSNLLTVSGVFEISASVSSSRTTTLTGTGTLAIGGNINVGTDGITPTAYRTNIMNFNGPNINVSGNINIYNRVAGTIYIASSINHTAGKLKLLGTGSSGYLNIYQDGTGLNGNNKYIIQDGTASIEFFHTSDTPVTYSYLTNAPIFNAIGSEIKYSGSINPSYILSTNYYNLNLNNPNNHFTTGAITVNNKLELNNGNLTITANLIINNTNNSETYININSGNGISGSPGLFSYGSSCNITYSGSTTAAGIELLTTTTEGSTNNHLKSITISGTSGFNLGVQANIINTNEYSETLYVNDFILINDDHFTLDFPFINCPNVNINGGVINPLTINSNISSSSTNTGITITGGSETFINGTLDSTGINSNISISGENYLEINNSITSDGAITLNSPEILCTLSISPIIGKNINISGDLLNLFNITSSDNNGINITGNNQITLSGSILANNNGPVNITGQTIANSSTAINCGNLVITQGGTSTLQNVTTTGINGINITANQITLSGSILANSNGPVAISGQTIANTGINCGNLVITQGGTSTLQNVTSTGINGISISATNLTLNNALTANNGLVSINASTTTTSTAATINAKEIILNGNNSNYGAHITATDTGLTINGTTTFSGTSRNINAKNIVVNAASTFKNNFLNVENFTINSNSIIEKTTSITNTLSLGATLTLGTTADNTAATFTTPTLNIIENSVFSPKSGTNKILKITDLLSVTPGKTFNTGNSVTLVSNSGKTARVGELTTTDAISGKVTIERYLPGGRKWRLLTSPLKGSTDNTIWFNWQNNGTSISNTGTDVWGPNSNYTESSVGLVYLNPSSHNFRKYENGAWSNVTNSKSTTTFALFSSTTNNAFLTFITGPFRTAYTGNTGNSQALPTTLIAKGELLIGTQTYTINNTNYYLIGNPYASPIDFSSIIDANGENGSTIAPKIWIMDPKLGTFGNYVTWDPVNKYSNPLAQNAINGQNVTVIQSGQAFFVKGKTGATSSSFKINENNKTSSVFTNVFGRNATTDFERIRVNLEKIGDTIPNRDACVVGFYQGASNTIDDNDVQKFSNPSETLAFYNGTTALSSEHRAPISDGDELFLRLTGGAISNYKLKIYTENFQYSGYAYFHDLKLGTITPMPIDGSIFEYPFEVTSDTTTQGVRFKIVFTSTLGLDDSTNTNTIKVFPNPTSKSNGITVNLGTLDFGTYSYRIINLLGQEIQKGELTNYELNQEFKIDFNTALNSGVYSFEVLENNKNIKTLKLLIN